MGLRFRRRAPAAATDYEAFGVRFSLRCEDPELRALAVEVLPPGTIAVDGQATDDDREPAPDDGRFAVAVTAPDRHEVTLEGMQLIAHASREVALELLDAQLRLFVASRAPELVFVHAGVVGWHRRAIAIPGQSFSGKTTLVAALVRAGATYLSDEYAPLDEHGRVHPFLRPLSIRAHGAAAAIEQHPGQLGAVADATVSLELGAVVITRYVTTGVWSPRVSSAGLGALALLANTVPAQARPHESLAAATRGADGAVVLEGDRGEAEPAAADILARLARAWP